MASPEGSAAIPPGGLASLPGMAALRAEELAEKERRLRAFMAEQGLGAILLTTHANFAWATGGGSNCVATNTETGVASLLFTPRRSSSSATTWSASASWRKRSPISTFTVVHYPWDEPDLAGSVQRLASGRVAADTAVPGTEPLRPEFAALRYALTPAEVTRYRELGLRMGLVMTRACYEVRPGLAEHQIAAMLGGRPPGLWHRADRPARGDGRARLPLPPSRADRAQAGAACDARRRRPHGRAHRHDDAHGPLRRVARRTAPQARRRGPGRYRLHHRHASGRPRRRHLPGRPRRLRQTGFPDEWRLHHQGGATGYAGRDYRATAHTTAVVQPSQAFAWNPTIAGTKSEDTILATEGGPQILTATRDLPTQWGEWEGARAGAAGHSRALTAAVAAPHPALRAPLSTKGAWRGA